MVLNEIKRGLPFPQATRLELINTRRRFTVPMTSAATGARSPAILFHPCRSIASLAVLNPNKVHDFAFIGRSTTDKDPNLWEWVGAEATSGNVSVDINAGAFDSAEATGQPASLISPLTRVTGGVLTLRVTCGPGTTGYLACSSPSLTELSYNQGLKDLFGAHATNSRVRRFELVQGTQTHHFIAPVTNPPALEHFAEANDRFTWGADDPYGATVITFHDIHYNDNLGVAPVVELFATVGLQCRLEVNDRHLATNHAHGTKDAKLKAVNGDSAHIGTTQNGHSEHVQATQKVDSRKEGGIR